MTFKMVRSKMALYFSLLCLVLTCAGSVQADTNETGLFSSIFDESDYVYFQTSLATVHFHPKEEHNNKQNLIGIDYHWKSGYLLGASFFKNSFHQSSQFGYFGRQWDIPNTNDLLYVSLVGGFIHGYRGEHKEEIPFNDHGTAPVVLPLIGARYEHFHSQLIVFGLAGFTWTLGYDIPVNW